MSQFLTQPPTPPPKFWWIEIVTNSPKDLVTTRNIIHSYLKKDQWSRKRKAKGRHLFRLKSIDHVIDRSIRATIENECHPGTICTWGVENEA